MHSPMERAEAAEILAPYAADLARPWRSAWKMWAQLPPAAKIAFAPRTRANVLYDYAIAEAKSVFGNRIDVSLTEDPGFLHLTVGDRLGLRFKKVDSDLATSGISTQQYTRWRRQMSIPGLEPLTNVTIGYQVSALGQLADVVFVCSIGTTPYWAIRAPEADDETGTVTPINTQPTLPAAPVIRIPAPVAEPEADTP